MSLDLRFGTVESSRHMRLAVDYVAAHPEGYEERHLAWTQEKLAPRLQDGEALAVMALYRRRVAGIGVVYARMGEDGILHVEQKVLRVTDDLQGRGIGALIMRNGFVAGAYHADATPGVPAIVHIDTRNPDVGEMVEHMGFERELDAELYTSGVLDRQYSKRTIVPDLKTVL